MKSYLPAIPKVTPLLLAYPKVYERLISRQSDGEEYKKVMDKCYDLYKNRPNDPKDRYDGYGFSKCPVSVFIVWSSDENKPDIFILGGPGDGFGPGHSCPTDEELQNGTYGDLVPVSFL